MLSGYKDIVELLVENGAEVDVTDFHDNTPLHFAASEGKWLTNEEFSI